MKILIIDDHPLFREGVRAIMERLGPDTEIVEAAGVEAGLAYAAGSDAIDLILLDLYLPGFGGIDALKLFRKGFPASRILMLSGTEVPTLIRECLANGAQGFIHKSVLADDMLAAVDEVMSGGSCCLISASFAEDGAEAARQLTPRQREVLSCISKGMSNKEIARELNISDNTVNIHVVNIFAILGVHSRTEAALFAKKYGLV